MAIRALGLGFVLSHEDPGLWGIVTSDSGGKTRYGISEKSYPGYWADGNQPDLAEMVEIFLNDFWIPLGCDHIQDQDMANRLVDSGINMGMKTAARIFQTAINDLGKLNVTTWVPLEVDGNIGENTLKWSTLPGLNTWFRKHLEDHYVSIAANNPSEAKYLNGWLARIA